MHVGCNVCGISWLITEKERKKVTMYETQSSHVRAHTPTTYFLQSIFTRPLSPHSARNSSINSAVHSAIISAFCLNFDVVNKGLRQVRRVFHFSPARNQNNVFFLTHIRTHHTYYYVFVSTSEVKQIWTETGKNNFRILFASKRWWSWEERILFEAKGFHVDGDNHQGSFS